MSSLINVGATPVSHPSGQAKKLELDAAGKTAGDQKEQKSTVAAGQAYLKFKIPGLHLPGIPGLPNPLKPPVPDIHHLPNPLKPPVPDISSRLPNPLKPPVPRKWRPPVMSPLNLGAEMRGMITKQIGELGSFSEGVRQKLERYM